MPFSHGATVTVERPGGLTRHGDRLPSTSHKVSGCAVYPNSTAEELSQRDTVVDNWTLLAPFDADITATDIVILPNGNRYEVDGAPGGFSSPYTGWRPGQRIVLRAVSG